MEESQEPEQTPKQSRAVLIAVIIIAVLAVAGVAAMIFANPTQAPMATQNEETSSNPQTDADTDTDANTGDATTETATITFTSSGFSPATLTVKKGTKVTVVNNSSSPVQFSSDDHPTHTHNREMNTAEIGPGESTSFTASTVGTHGFHDHIDDNKTGTLVVTE